MVTLLEVNALLCGHRIRWLSLEFLEVKCPVLDFISWKMKEISSLERSPFGQMVQTCSARRDQWDGSIGVTWEPRGSLAHTDDSYQKKKTKTKRYGPSLLLFLGCNFLVRFILSGMFPGQSFFSFSVSDESKNYLLSYYNVLLKVMYNLPKNYKMNTQVSTTHQRCEQDGCVLSTLPAYHNSFSFSSILLLVSHSKYSSQNNIPRTSHPFSFI